jgi:proteasome lid subunit RPN8/RPN11
LIRLDIGRFTRRAVVEDAEPRSEHSLEVIHQRLRDSVEDLSRLLDDGSSRTCYMPTEALMQALGSLMPPERMGVFAGRWMGGRFVSSTLYDVTGHAHRSYVRADPRALGDALLAFERAGVELAVWIHSHPGAGPGATVPSSIDRQQYANWSRHYGTQLIGMIVVRDGYIRVWGDAVESGRAGLAFLGDGLDPLEGYTHVYRLR